MPHTLRRVPGPFEVDILQAEIGGDQGFMTRRNRKHGAVVPNIDSAMQPSFASFCGPVANPANQRFLRQRHGALNIQGSWRRERPRSWGDIRGAAAREWTRAPTSRSTKKSRR